MTRLVKDAVPIAAHDVTKIRQLAMTLEVHLDVWARRNLAESQPNICAAGDWALDVVEDMRRRLTTLHTQLLYEIQASESAEADRAAEDEARRHR